MKKRTKIILLAVLVVGAIAAFYGYSEYTRGHKDLSNEKADVTLTAQELMSAFETDEAAANTKYLDKAISVTGTVKAIDKNEAGGYSVQLIGSDMGNVSCEMDERHNADAEKLHTGDNVTMKGTCTGMLMDVILIRCVIDK